MLGLYISSLCYSKIASIKNLKSNLNVCFDLKFKV